MHFCNLTIGSNKLINYADVMTAILPTLLKLHVHAQRLCGKTPSKRFKSTVKVTWKQVMDSFAPVLEHILDTYEQSKDPLDLLNATLAYLELPGRYLVRMLGKTPAHGLHKIVFEDIDSPPSILDSGPLQETRNGPPPPNPFTNLSKDPTPTAPNYPNSIPTQSDTGQT
jgi:hypothetical protein